MVYCVFSTDKQTLTHIRAGTSGEESEKCKRHKFESVQRLFQMANLNPDIVATFKKQSAELAKTAKAIMATDKSKLVESEDKFLHIRAVRAEHLDREVQSGKSRRV